MDFFRFVGVFSLTIPVLEFPYTAAVDEKIILFKLYLEQISNKILVFLKLFS